MRILLIEDDEEKRRKVTAFLRESLSGVVLDESKSLHSGLRAILESRPDLIILDMTLPTFDIGPEEDGGRPQAYGGRELLRDMKRRNIAIATVVLTGFDRFGEGDDLLTLSELDAQLQANHPEHYWGAIHYNVTDEGWKGDLLTIIRARMGDKS